MTDHQGMTETATQTAPVPGWYQDPQGQGLRWWDGTGWTTHVQQSPAPAQPAAAAPQAQPAQAAATPAVAQPASAGPSAVATTTNSGVKVTGGEKKSGGSLSDKLNDNPLPVLLVLAAVLVVVVVLFVL